MTLQASRSGPPTVPGHWYATSTEDLSNRLLCTPLLLWEAGELIARRATAGRADAGR